MTGEEYEFHIDVFTLTTIPMARLAEYMRELALLMGNPSNVHFKGVKKGSVRIVAAVDISAAPKVRVRLQNARHAGASDEVNKTYRKLDDMLRNDNAVARIIRGTTNVVRFPGRERARNPLMGPFTEHAEFDGKIVRIGGTDDTAHALLERAPGDVISAECSRELARQLAPFLYGAPVRLVGTARWVRLETGEWDMKSFRAKEFAQINADDLATVVGRLRGIEAEWKRDADPVALIRKVRGNGEAH